MGACALDATVPTGEQAARERSECVQAAPPRAQRSGRAVRPPGRPGLRPPPPVVVLGDEAAFRFPRPWWHSVFMAIESVTSDTHSRRGTCARPLARLRSLPLERGRAATGPVPGTALKTRWRRPGNSVRVHAWTSRVVAPASRAIPVSYSSLAPSPLLPPLHMPFHSLGASPGQTRS